MTGSAVLLVLGIAMGAAFFWDIGGLATRMRARLDEQPGTGRLHRGLPTWAYRAFGIWCFLFAAGQFVYIATVTKG